MDQQTPAVQLGCDAVASPATQTTSEDDILVHHDLLPFPDSVPTAPLLRSSLMKLTQGDEDEKRRRGCGGLVAMLASSTLIFETQTSRRSGIVPTTCLRVAIAKRRKTVSTHW